MKRLPTVAVAVLAALLDRCAKTEGCGWMTVNEIAEEMETSRVAAFIALSALARMGAVESRREHNSRGYAGKQYRITRYGKELAVRELERFVGGGKPERPPKPGDWTRGA